MEQTGALWLKMKAIWFHVNHWLLWSCFLKHGFARLHYIDRCQNKSAGTTGGADVSYWQVSADIYRQCLFMKAATLLFCFWIVRKSKVLLRLRFINAKTSILCRSTTLRQFELVPKVQTVCNWPRNIPVYGVTYAWWVYARLADDWQRTSQGLRCRVFHCISDSRLRGI